MSKHTEGPWIVLGKSAGHVGDLDIGRDDESAYPVAIAADQPTGDETLANARLIAASPDLLRALEAVASELDAIAKGWAMTSESRNLVTEAIKKAEGT